MTLPAAVTEYLDGIDATPTVKARIQVLVFAIEDILSSEGAVSRIFLNTYVDENGNTNYDNAWVFANDQCLEITNFLQSDYFRVDSTILARSVLRWEITSEKFDFTDEPTPASRMNISFLVSGGPITGTMRASGMNCKYLYDIFKEILVPNLVSATRSAAMFNEVVSPPSIEA